MSDYKQAKKSLERELSVSLLTKADDLAIELPPETDSKIWVIGDVNGELITLLTTHGRGRVRQLVDAELARRFEVKTLFGSPFLPHSSAS